MYFRADTCFGNLLALRRLSLPDNSSPSQDLASSLTLKYIHQNKFKKKRKRKEKKEVSRETGDPDRSTTIQRIIRSHSTPYSHYHSLFTTIPWLQNENDKPKISLNACSLKYVSFITCTTNRKKLNEPSPTTEALLPSTSSREPILRSHPRLSILSRCLRLVLSLPRFSSLSQASRDGRRRLWLWWPPHRSLATLPRHHDHRSVSQISFLSSPAFGTSE